MQSKATTAKDYLAELPKERRAAIAKVRSVIRKNLPKGCVETMAWGMITYVIPFSRYPAGYLDQKDVPLPYAALASQKHYMAVYLDIYTDPSTKKWFLDSYKKSGKRMDVGKSCIRFRKIEDLPLELIGQAVARTSVAEYIKKYEAARKRRLNS